MRKYILVLALLFCGWFFLAAQSRPPDATIFVTSVTGRGSRTEDNTLFYKQLVLEITSQGFNMAKTQKNADFSLVGNLARYAGYEGQFAFHLELRDNKTGEMKAEGDLLYEATDDASQQLPFLLTTLLYTIPVDNSLAGKTPSRPTPNDPITDDDGNPYETIPEEPDKSDDWRDKWLYLGLAVTWNPRIYMGEPNNTYYLPGSPHFSISSEFHVLNSLSFELGFEMSADRRDIYKNTIIEIPLLIKFVAKPNASFMFEPYAGAHFNIPILNEPSTQPPILTLLAGFQYAIKAGPGAVFLDARVGRDIDRSTVKPPSGISYVRYIAHFGLGYKYGIFQRKIK